MEAKQLNISKSLFFLLPLIAENGKDCKAYTGNSDYAMSNSERIIEGFIFDENEPDKDNHLILKVDLMFDIGEDTKSIYKLLIDSDSFDGKKDYRIDGITDTYIHMKLPDVYEGIHNAIVKGNFDMIPRNLIIKILLFWNLQSSAEAFEYAISKSENISKEETIKIEDVYHSRHGGHIIDKIERAMEIQNMQSVIDE